MTLELARKKGLLLIADYIGPRAAPGRGPEGHDEELLKLFKLRV